jgi:hypothetical protein
LLHQKCYTTRMKKRVKIKALTAPNNIPGASWNAPDTALARARSKSEVAPQYYRKLIFVLRSITERGLWNSTSLEARVP